MTKTLKKSSIDYKNHDHYYQRGKCFVCKRPFTRQESTYVGVGPHCGGWEYKWENDVPPEGIDMKSMFGDYFTVSTVKEKMNGHKAFKANVFSFVRETEKAINVEVNNQSHWIPKKSVVHFEGYLFVSHWKADEIVEDYVEAVKNVVGGGHSSTDDSDESNDSDDSETEQETDDDQDVQIVNTGTELIVTGETYDIKEELKKIGFWWGGYDPEPHWKRAIRNIKFSEVQNTDLDQYIKDAILQHFQNDNKASSEAEEIDEDEIYEPKEIDLYEHQKEGVRKINNNDAYMLSWEMGAGKTFAPLSYAKTKDEKIFAVVPASIRLNWFREADKFEMKPFFYPKLPSMKADSRDYFGKYEDEQNEILITSYTTFNSTVRLPKSERPRRVRSWEHSKLVDMDEINRITDEYDVIVLDESQYIKNYKAQRTRSCLALIENAKAKGKRVVFLTGTPLLNRPAELYTTLNQLDENLEGFKEFTRKYNGAYNNGYGWTMGQPSNLDDLHQRLTNVSMRVLKDECLDLPEKVRQDIRVSNVNVDVPKKPRNKDQLLGWLQEYKKAISEAKVKHTIDLASSGIPCLVFTGYIDVNNEIAEKLRNEGLSVGQIYSGVGQDERDQIVEGYQNGEIDVVVAGIKAAGVGLTLTRGSNVIFNDMDWTPGNMLQAEDRAHRVGQNNNVTVSVLVAEEDDLDQMLWSKINNKFSTVTKTLDGSEENFSNSSTFKEIKDYFVNKFNLD